MAADELYEDAVRIVRSFGRASTPLLQRRLRIGYARAAHLIDLMEERHVVDGDGKLIDHSKATYLRD